MVEHAIGYGLLCAVSNVLWFIMHIEAKYEIIAFGYRKKQFLNKIQRRHKRAKWWRKLFLSELAGNVTEHEFLVFICWLVHAIVIICGPLASLACYVLVCVSGFETEYAIIMLKIPVMGILAYNLLFFIPDLLYIPDFRNMYKLKRGKARRRR